MKPKQKIEYIENNKKYGIKIDWNIVKKDLRKLKIPKDVYQFNIPIDKVEYSVLFSRRNTGKTTQALLLGMILYVEYGIRTELLRQTKDMVKATYISELFKTVIEFEYVKKITGGVYSDIYYHARKFYFCNYQENEKTPSDRDKEPFLVINTLDNCKNIKSTYVSPTGDWILLDEFQSPSYSNDEFSNFLNIISTIRRHRRSTKIILLGNTIDAYCYYFKQMLINNEVLTMNPFDNKIVTNPKGARIYIEYVETRTQDTADKKTQKEIEYDMRYYGFENNTSLVGGGWDLMNYPTIPKGFINDSELIERFYLNYGGNYLKLDLRYNDNYGTICCVSPTYDLDETHIIFTNEDVKSRNYIKGIGISRNSKMIFKLFEMGRMFFATNDCGSIMEHYIHESC